MYSNVKAVLAGDVLHTYTYNKPIKYGEDNRKNNSGFSTSGNSDTTEFHKNRYRVQKRVRLLLEANAFQHFERNRDNGLHRRHKPVFVTLTFATDVKETSVSNKLFNSYTKRFNYLLDTQYGSPRSSWLAVPEFQPVSRRVHYHVVYFNIPYITRVYDTVSTIWGHGFVNVQTVRTLRHITTYVSKYLTKQRDEQLLYQKAFLTSTGLKQPIELRDQTRIQELHNTLSKPNYTSTYEHDGLQTQYRYYRVPSSLRADVLGLCTYGCSSSTGSRCR